MIHNPILTGFCPDPSIIRAGEDYYIATSTFEWWPGVRLFHSKDLQQWEQIPSPLRRESQLNMVGDPTSGGVWAPCLSYDGKYFYLVYTDVKTKKGRYYNTHNYVVWTEDIYGDWSDPVYLNSIGFDPSLFHDTDGRKYLINMVNGFKGVLVQELDPKTLQLMGERKKVYAGSGIGCTEGPHMYHIGDWYYLLVAEGGTGYDHCVTMARSKSIWGPFETAPYNPILTSDKEDVTQLQRCGHADFVETAGGEWYMVHLCSRPLGGLKWSTLGRETAIQKMYWDAEGWLRLKPESAENAKVYAEENGGVHAGENGAGVPDNFARLQTEEPAGICLIGEEHGKSACKNVPCEAAGAESFYDDFEEEKLSVRYSSPRTSYEEFADCKARKGWVRLKGRESMNSLHHVSLLAARQRTACAEAETLMEFAPEYPEQLAGLAYMYDAMNFYIFGKTVTEEGKAVLTLIKSDTGVITDEVKEIEIPADRAVALKVQVTEDGTKARFFYRIAEEDESGEQDGKGCRNAEKWIQAGGFFTTEILTDEHCRGFTGAHFGLYIHDMTGLSFCADFDYFRTSKNVQASKEE